MNPLRQSGLVLTVPAHADSQTLLQPTVLTTVTVDPENRAALVLGARLVLNLLLNRTTEEALQDR